MPESPKIIAAAEIVPPGYKNTSFHCPHCGVYAQQSWFDTTYGTGGAHNAGLSFSRCQNCRKRTIWMKGIEVDVAEMLYPSASSAPMPHPDTPPDVRPDYDEARDIVRRSPRGACALLRLALQKLMPHLGETGRDINTDIASLVAKGLPLEIQQALDTLRVVGNEAVHPGELDLKDDQETATALFGVFNYIVEQRIAQPKALQALYEKLPASKLAGIAARDSSTKPPTTT